MADRVVDVIQFIAQDNRDLYPREMEDGSIVQPGGVTDAHKRLWRSTRGLMEQLEKETGSRTEVQLADHFDHVLGKRAQLMFDMVKDHASKLAR